MKTDFEAKTKEHTEKLSNLCTKLTDYLTEHLSAGLQDADTQEVGMVVDMIKDLCIAKEKVVKAIYYESIGAAMEESEYGEDYDEDGMIRGYRGRSRTTGRYVHRAGYQEPMMPRVMRDMDRDIGRMYYADGSMGSSGTSNGSVSGGNSGGSVMGGGAMGYSENNRGRNDSGNQHSEGRRRGYEEGYSDGMADGSMRNTSSSKFERARRGYDESKQKGAEKQEKLEKLQGMMDSLTEELAPYAMDADASEKSVIRNGAQRIINKFS